MARLGYRQVKTRVRLALFGTTDFIDPRVTILQPFKCQAQPLAVHVCGAQGGIKRAGRFQRMPKLQQVALRLGIAFKQLQQGITEGRPQ